MAPALCNVFWIGAALFYRNASILFAMQRVAYAIALGMCLQWLVTFIPVFFKGKSKWKRGLKRRWYVPSREVNRFFQVLFIGAIGVGASQINSFCDSLFARYADLNGPVYLWYAVRFYHLLFTLFGIAMVSTLAPSLSRAFKQKEHDRAKGLFGFGFRSLSVATVIATFALCSLGTPLVDLIFGWGHFSPEAVQKTSFCLIAYGLGLFPASVWLLDSAVCYNQGKWHLPVILSCISVIFNIGCNAFFLFFWQFGVVSIACATSLSAWLQFIGLRLLLSKKGWSPHFLASDLFHWITAGSLACLASEFALSFFSLSSKGAAFFLPALLFGCVIVSYAYLGKNRDLLELLQTYLYWKRGLRGLGKKEWKQMKGKSN